MHYLISENNVNNSFDINNHRVPFEKKKQIIMIKKLVNIIRNLVYPKNDVMLMLILVNLSKQLKSQGFKILSLQEH